MWNDLIQLLFPKTCFGCQEILLENELILCAICREHLPFTNQHKIKENQAYQKFYGRIAIENAACYLYFSKGGIIQRIMHELKYNNHPEISYFLGKMYALELKKSLFNQPFDAIIPVPLHKTKLKARGYNQVDGFAKALSETFEVPVNNNLLYKSKNYKSQTLKSRFERTSKTEEKFLIRFSEKDTNKHYLLIDDILTTGGTLEACGKKLLQIPKTKLSILCLTFTY